MTKKEIDQNYEIDLREFDAKLTEILLKIKEIQRELKIPNKPVFLPDTDTEQSIEQC